MYALAKKTADINDADQVSQVNPDPRVTEKHNKREKTTKHSQHVSDKNTPIQIDSVKGTTWTSDDGKGNRLNKNMKPPQEHHGANENTRTDAARQSKRGADSDGHDALPPAIPVRFVRNPSLAHRTACMGLNDALPPSRDEVSVVPIAIMVTDDDRNEAEDPNSESIMIATRVSPSRKTRLRMSMAFPILVLCGTIAGVVYAVVKPPPPPPPPTLPFTPKATCHESNTRKRPTNLYNHVTSASELNRGGNWQQIAVIVETDFVDNIALSGDGTILAISMPSNDDTRDDGGKIQVYQEATDGKFQKRGQAIYGMTAGDRIGGYYDDDGYENDDAQFPFDDDLKQDKIFSTESYDRSSMALSENGTILAMGSPIGNFGQVFVLDKTKNEWVLFGDNTVFVGEAEGDKFGTSVDISADGTRVVVGARNNTGKPDPSYWIYNGHAQAFQYFQERSS